MQRVLVAIGTLALAVPVQGTGFRGRRTAQEPNTACGKGYDNLVEGSKEYYADATSKLWVHPWRKNDKDTFEKEYQCWFASMCTSKCGGLSSKADTRKKELTETCLSDQADWLKVWNMFDQAEIEWFKKSYPANNIEEESSGEALEALDGEGSSTIHYKEAMDTSKELSKKELLCLTLFTIDDECVKWPYIRLGK